MLAFGPSRGKHVEATLKTFDPATKRFITGHQFVTGTLYCRGLTIPFGIRLHLNKISAQVLKQPHKKLTSLASEIIQALDLPRFWKGKVYCLIVTAYFNKSTLQAAKSKGSFVIGALKKN